MCSVIAYDRLLDALRGNGSQVRENRIGQTLAQCPAHDDRSPSLSVTGIEGRVLLYCHAGCADGAVLGALGLAVRDLFDEPRGTSYRYDDGRVVHRTPDKKFRQSGRTQGTAALYRLDRVKAAVAESQPVFVVEGEQDVHAAESIGVTATCSPMGAGKWHKVDPSPLHGGKVLIVADQDEPGRKHAADVLASLTGHADAAIVAPRTGKDLADHIAAGHPIGELVPLRADDDPDPRVDRQGGEHLLDDVRELLGRFVAFPSTAAVAAVTLWAAHSHLVHVGENSPRLALLSPEPGSGKTRTLEVLELLTPAPMSVLSASPAAVFRSIEAERPTLLMDEVDAIFNRRGGDDGAEDLRALLNAGHRRGATIPRCVGPRHDVVRFPVYCAVAMAGLGDLPDTLMSRAVIIRMRRRAPGERVEPFRRRLHAATGHELRDRLAGWAQAVAEAVGDAWPEMPAGVTDRPADVWEPLLAVADAAGGHWPATARTACVELAAVAENREASLGVRLLADLRTVFADRETMHTETILDALHKLDESPWADLRGKPLDPRGLARRLRQYGITSVDVKIADLNRKGYRREHLWDTWTRYLAPSPPESATCATPATGTDSERESAATGVADRTGGSATSDPDRYLDNPDSERESPSGSGGSGRSAPTGGEPADRGRADHPSGECRDCATPVPAGIQLCTGCARTRIDAARSDYLAGDPDAA